MTDEDLELENAFKQMAVPLGAQYQVDSFFYKIGKCGILFRWSCDRWVNSQASRRKVIQNKYRIGND